MVQLCQLELNGKGMPDQLKCKIMYCFTFLTWLTVLSARKNFFLLKQFWAGNAEVNCKHPVIHLVFPCSFFSSVIVLHSFLNARVPMVPIFKRKEDVKTLLYIERSRAVRALYEDC